MSSNTHVEVKRAILFLVTPFIVAKFPQTNIFPSGCWTILFTWVVKLQVNVSSNTQVLVNLANQFLVTPFIVVKFPQTNTFPSDWVAILLTKLLVKLQVNVTSNIHVEVKRATLFLVIPFIVVKLPQTNTFPSDWVAILFIDPPKLPVKLLSNHPQGGLKLTIVIVTQLVKLTHTSFVHKLIAVLGTTVQIQFITTAVHIVAHHVP